MKGDTGRRAVPVNEETEERASMVLTFLLSKCSFNMNPPTKPSDVTVIPTGESSQRVAFIPILRINAPVKIGAPATTMDPRADFAGSANLSSASIDVRWYQLCIRHFNAAFRGPVLIFEGWRANFTRTVPNLANCHESSLHLLCVCWHGFCSSHAAAGVLARSRLVARPPPLARPLP